jgi:hypothetical protein
MDYSKTPHVVFKGETLTEKMPDERLVRELVDGLERKFGVVRLRKRRLLRIWTMLVKGDSESFSIFIRKFRPGGDECVLLAAPSRTPPFLEVLRGRRPVDYSTDLAEICKVVHSSLAACKGIEIVSWFFSGSGKQSPAVRTPDELPWKD